MSTKQRYGSAVWKALAHITRHYAHDNIIWATVGEVSKQAGVSKPTAKKYLTTLVEMGSAVDMEFGTRKGYRPAPGGGVLS